MDAQKQLGNAVPALLAEILGREIRKQLLGHRLRERPLALEPTRRKRIPAPEPTARVPSRYLQYVGNHSAHPGTGKGYAMVARAADKI
jgi:DNA (cytosine-5)-methyltransferase 1